MKEQAEVALTEEDGGCGRRRGEGTGTVTRSSVCSVCVSILFHTCVYACSEIYTWMIA